MTNAARWTADHLPELTGKTIVITGGNGGLGCEAASQLARTGAHLVLACRDLRKAQNAIEAIRSVRSGATLDAMELDLANLVSVRKFAEAYRSRHQALDVLCNNAGVMALPYRKTADGFEMQFGTNHLGHFALTGLLLEPLLRTNGARVINVSSGAHRFGRIRFDDLQWDGRYRKWAAYAQSKLANLLFTYELQRRFEAAQANVMSVACHPGYAATDLQFAGPRMAGSSVLELGAGIMNRLLAQSAAMGALPILYAATVPGVRGGDYIGPDGIGEMRGFPKRVGSSARSYDREAARKLWEISESLTGVHYAF